MQLEVVYLEALMYVDYGFWFGYQGTIKLWVPPFLMPCGVISMHDGKISWGLTGDPSRFLLTKPL